MRKKVKAVYFSDAEEDLEMLQWVERKGNFSRYVRSLIAADMRGDVDPRLLAAVERIVESKLKGRQLTDRPDVADDLLAGIF